MSASRTAAGHLSIILKIRSRGKASATINLPVLLDPFLFLLSLELEFLLYLLGDLVDISQLPFLALGALNGTSCSLARGLAEFAVGIGSAVSEPCVHLLGLWPLGKFVD